MSSSRFQVLLAALLVLTGFAVLSVTAHGKPATPGNAWAMRCDAPAKDVKAGAPRVCEVYQRLSVTKTGQRVVEFAVGFSNSSHDSARGVLILPLGVLLTDDMQMQIDNSKTFRFKVRYCTDAGCFAILDFDKNALGALRDGKVLTINGHAFNGQPLAIKLQLDGLAKALKQL